MTHSSRLFFALWPDENTRQTLAGLGQAIAINEYKWLNPQNFHVTLVFIGNVDTATELLIRQSVAGVSAEAFELMFDRISYWSKPRILCLTCREPAFEILTLAATLDKAVTACGIQTDTRPYTPHVTLARHCPAFMGYDCEPIVWRAESFCLVESCSEPDGVCYKVIREWPFNTKK